MRSEFEVAFNEIAELRALPRETVLEALSTALISAYKRDAGVGSSQRVEANIDPNSGRARIFVEKEVVDSVHDHRTEVELEKARYYDQAAELGDMVMVQVEGTTKKFGRIAAQTAKQVILQKIREAERNSLYDEYIEKEGDVITGVVQSINSNMVTLSLNNRAEAILPRAQQIPGERYRPHDKLRVHVLEVKRSNRGPQIIVSRSHRDMLRRLLEYEVPEIYSGQVEIKNIAREAGYRSKVAVSALQEGIDPVGACVGMRGIRIQNIVKELHDEKIDVIEWNSDHEAFIAKALSPARVSGVYLEDDPDNGRTAVVIVPDDQLSLAIGREGQNARLAAKLTGWRIDIKSVTEATQEALEIVSGPAMAVIHERYGDLVADAERIIDKRVNNKAVMPEEYTTLGRFADLVQRRLMEIREEERQQRLAEINAVKSTLPAAAFQVAVEELELDEGLIEALKPLGTAGEVMLRFLIDEDRLKRLLAKHPEDSLDKIQEALDQMVLPEVIEEIIAEPEPEAEIEMETAVDVAEEVVAEAQAEPIEAIDAVETAEAVEAVEEVEAVAEPEPELEVEAIADVQPEPVAVETVLTEQEQDAAKRAKKKGKGKAATEPELTVFPEEEVDDLLEEREEKRAKKKERQQRRQMVYDEDLGEVVVKRRRKGSRRQDSWDEWDE